MMTSLGRHLYAMNKGRRRRMRSVMNSMQLVDVLLVKRLNANNIHSEMYAEW